MSKMKNNLEFSIIADLVLCCASVAWWSVKRKLFQRMSRTPPMIDASDRYSLCILRSLGFLHSNIRTWRPEDSNIRAWRPEYSNIRAWRPEYSNIRAWRPEYSNIRAWRPEYSNIRAWRPEYSNIRAWRPEYSNIQCVVFECWSLCPDVPTWCVMLLHVGHRTLMLLWDVWCGWVLVSVPWYSSVMLLSVSFHALMLLWDVVQFSWMLVSMPWCHLALM